MDGSSQEPSRSRLLGPPGQGARTRLRGIGLALLIFALPVLRPAPGIAGGERTLTLLHTNDVHGAFDERPATWRDDRAPAGGYARLAGLVDRIREDTPRVLLLDAGDLMTGDPVCDIEVDGVLGGSLVEFMNAVGYDAMALGNHEFDHGAENARGLARLARFPVICANLFERDTGDLFASSSHALFELDGLRVGVIGLIMEDLSSVTMPSRIERLRVADPVETTRRLVDALDDETDLLVLLTHMGVEEDRRLAREIEGVDVIVGGHSHTRLDEPEVVNGIIIVQAGSRLTSLGRLDLTVEDDRVTSHRGTLLDITPPPAAPRDDLARRAEALREKIHTLFGREVGRAAASFERSYYEESSLGRWVADQLRARVQVDFAVVNSGGLRRDLEAGPVTLLDLYGICPFGNGLATFSCTGEDLLSLARANARAMLEESYGILQVSGLTFSWRPDSGSPEGVEVVDLQVGGEPVDREAVYRGATSDYLVQQAPRYLGFVPDDATPTGETLYQALARTVRAAGTFGPDPQERMVRLPPAEELRVGGDR
jgi:5'-nucleotidase/UDP-sugar diphosphatase